MPNVIPSPYLGMPIPTLTDPGPDYATNVNNCLLILDSTVGPPINIANESIGNDLNIDGYNIANMRSVQFQNQSGVLTGSQDVNSAYFQNNIFGVNDNNGNFIPIVENGQLATSAVFQNLSVVSIAGTNLTIPPNASYNVIDVNTLSGPSIVQLPIASAVGVGVGRFFYVADVGGDAGSNNITIQVPTGSGNTIRVGGSAAASFVLNSNGATVLLFTDGVSKWQLVSNTNFVNQNVTLKDCTLTLNTTSSLNINSGFVNCDDLTTVTIDGLLNSVGATAQLGPMTLSGAGQIYHKLTTVGSSTPYTVDSASGPLTDEVIAVVNSTGGTFVVKLPQVINTPAGRILTITDGANTAATHNIGVNVFSGDTITTASVTSLFINTNGGTMRLMSNGSTVWYLV